MSSEGLPVSSFVSGEDVFVSSGENVAAEILDAAIEGGIEKERLELIVRGLLARRGFTAECFADFFWCIFRHELSAVGQKWTERAFGVFSLGRDDEIRGILNKAYRGSGKSLWAEALMLFGIGHFPWKSSLIVQARDEDAKRTAELLADIIARSDGWRAVFPWVRPDIERGWSLSGYHVKDEREDYAKWIQKCTTDHGRDFTFMAASVMAGSIGVHPTLFLLMDDIHDSKNVSSPAERQRVVNTVKADILPTMSRPGAKPFFVCSYTPWHEEDAYIMLEESGMFALEETPAEVDGVPVWPEMTTAEELERWRRVLGRREYERMMLLKRGSVVENEVPYYSYSSSLISSDWVIVGGADPTNVMRAAGQGGRKASHFALAYVAKIPNGGAVVVDGVLEQCSQLEAEAYIKRAQTVWPRWKYTMVENAGAGSLFIQACRRDASLRIIASDIYSRVDGRKVSRSKRDRLAIEMFPWFENSVVRIADRETPFLNALRKFFKQFYDLDDHDPAFDAADAVYHALKGMPEVLRISDAAGDGAETARQRGAVYNSPFAGIGRWKG